MWSSRVVARSIAKMRRQVGRMRPLKRLKRKPMSGTFTAIAGVEGIVSKRKDTPYRSGRSADWLAEATAKALGLTIAWRPLPNSRDVDALFASIVANGDEALYVVFDPLTIREQKRIVSGAVAFNATVTLRKIEDWIERPKKSIEKKSGARWGVLVHENRILATAVFKNFNTTTLSKPINDFSSSLDKAHIDALCNDSYDKVVRIIESQYPGKFLAVLFKNPTTSKQVFEAAI